LDQKKLKTIQQQEAIAAIKSFRQFIHKKPLGSHPEDTVWGEKLTDS